MQSAGARNKRDKEILTVKLLHFPFKLENIHVNYDLGAFKRFRKSLNKAQTKEEVSELVSLFYEESHDISTFKVAFFVVKNRYVKLSIAFAEKVLLEEFCPNFARAVLKFYKKKRMVDAFNELDKQVRSVEGLAPSYKNAKAVFGLLAGAGGDAGLAVRWLRAAIREEPKNKYRLYKVFFSAFKDVDGDLAIFYGLAYYKNKPEDLKFFKVLLVRLERLKKIDDILSATLLAKSVEGGREYEEIHEDYRLLKLVMESGEMELDVFRRVDLQHNQSRMYSVAYQHYAKQGEFELADKFAAKFQPFANGKFSVRKLSDYHFSRGRLNEAMKILSRRPEDDFVQLKQKSVGAFIELNKNGASIKLDRQQSYKPGNKIFYLLHNRLPYNSGGYAARTHGLLSSVENYEVEGVSRLGYPHDRPDFKLEPFKSFDVVDGVKYNCLQTNGNGYGQIPITDYLQSYAEALQQFCVNEKPMLIHAASNYMNGVVANAVAKSLGIKSVYEVRGLWEITRISRDPLWEKTEYFEMMASLEAQAAKGADLVFTITEALRDEMVSRGVNRDKIKILPNGVDSSRFTPLPRNESLASELGLEGKVVIGFVGSVVDYEGLDYLVDAVQLLRVKGGTNFAVLIVGDGAALESIEERVDERGLSEFFVFTGRVSHEKVEEYYSVIDICPFPRKGVPVCEMVSPLKPFEAMGMEKAVLSSNVAALTEIVNGENGLLFEKDSIESLAQQLEKLIEDDELRNNLGQTARRWTVENRDWGTIIQKLESAYESLLEA